MSAEAIISFPSAAAASHPDNDIDDDIFNRLVRVIGQAGVKQHSAIDRGQEKRPIMYSVKEEMKMREAKEWEEWKKGKVGKEGEKKVSHLYVYGAIHVQDMGMGTGISATMSPFRHKTRSPRRRPFILFTFVCFSGLLRFGMMHFSVAAKLFPLSLLNKSTL